MATRKSSRSNNSRTNGRTSSNPAVETAMKTAEALRERFENRLGEVRSRFRSFEKDWSKTVDHLVTRGRSAEKDLRKRLDKVTRDLTKSPLVARVKKNPTYLKIKQGDVTGLVRGVNYEKAIKSLRKEVRGFQHQVGEFFQTSTSRVKQVIDLPSRTDFDRLNRKIESLSTQVRSLESKRKRA